MKIWIINEYATDELGRHHSIARYLARLGHEVTVVAGRWHHLLRDEAAAMAAAASQVLDGYRYHLVDMPRYAHAHDWRRVRNWFLFAWRIRKLERVLGDRPDVILYSSPSLIGYLGAEHLARRLGAKLIFEVRDIWPLTLMEIGGHSPRHPFIRFSQWVEDRAYRNADAVFSNLPLAHQHMAGRGMLSEKFQWIPNGIDVAAAKAPLPAPDKVMQRIPLEGFKIIYAGTLGVANALDALIDAMVLLKGHKDVHLLLLGAGKEKARLQQRVEALGLDRVILLGAVGRQQVPSVISQADAAYLGALSSPLYRYGVAMNKLFDYLLAAKPIIYAIDSGDYQPVAECGAGLSIAPESPQEIADAILALKALTGRERREMGERGRVAVLERHDYAVIAQTVSELTASWEQ